MRAASVAVTKLWLLTLVGIFLIACRPIPTTEIAPMGTASPPLIDTPLVSPTLVHTPVIPPTRATVFPLPDISLVTATPVFIPNPIPTHTGVPTISNPQTDSYGYRLGKPDAAILTSRALGHLRWLSQSLGVRSSTSAAEREAAEYIARKLNNFGYLAKLQQFPVHGIQPVGRYLTIDAQDDRSFTAVVMTGSGVGEATGSIVDVGLGSEGDFPPEGLDGRIALIGRGEISFRRKVENAQQSGAIGVVIYNQGPELFRGNLSRDVAMPVVGISRYDGEEILRLLEASEVTVTLEVVMNERSSQNVVATLNADKDFVVVLGAHYDTVPQSPGANDNGSGIAVVMAVAQELADKDLPFELRVIAFGSEELGLLGSRHYVDTLLQNEPGKIVVMLNFDALGAGFLQLLGNDYLVARAMEMAEDLDINVVVGRMPIGASSDHTSFQEMGIPVIFLSGSDISLIHSPDDRIEFVDPHRLGEAAKLGLGIIEYLVNERR